MTMKEKMMTAKMSMMKKRCVKESCYSRNASSLSHTLLVLRRFISLVKYLPLYCSIYLTVVR